MPRRKAPITTTTAATATPPSKAHKRHLSSSAIPAATATPGSRQSKRIKASTANTPTINSKNVTLKKSKYFEDPGSDSNSDDDDDDKNQGAASPAVAEEAETSDYENEDASVSHASSALPSSPSSSEEEEASDSDDPRKKGRKRKPANKRQIGSGANVSATNVQSTTIGGGIEKGKELWRQGVKAGLGPGKAVFIERPKPRGEGGIKYVPERIHPNTMAFLGDLKANNEREWLKSEWRFSFVWMFAWIGAVGISLRT